MVVIGVAGASASGKTVLSEILVNELQSHQVIVVSEDRYYRSNDNKSFAEKSQINYDHPDAFEHDLLQEHIKELTSGNSVNVPEYDYKNHTRNSKKTLYIPSDTKILILEGILLFHNIDLRNLMDIKIYMDTPLDICFIRRLKRDILERGRSLDSVIKQYEKTVRPMYTKFIEPSKKYADIIIPNTPSGAKNLIAIDLLKAKLNSFLKQ